MADEDIAQLDTVTQALSILSVNLVVLLLAAEVLPCNPVLSPSAE